MISKMKPAPTDERRLAHRHRLQRLAALHRRRRLGESEDPPLDHRERQAGGHRRPARPDLLQHRHLHLRLDRDQPQAPRAARQGATHRRHPLLPEDEEEPRQQAQADLQRPDRRHHPRLRSSPRAARRKVPNDGGIGTCVISRSSRTANSAAWEMTDERPSRMISRQARALRRLDAEARSPTWALRRSARTRPRSSVRRMKDASSKRPSAIGLGPSKQTAGHGIAESSRRTCQGREACRPTLQALSRVPSLPPCAIATGRRVVPRRQRPTGAR